ncbi:MAG: NAD-dependent epimerase/dehydratase family protein, partial [Aquificaceae bacterium]|nr:NAD-dependent epimerase/dehydratase family protein [Aquificaceae bacterium]
MKVLLTGATGFVGRYVARELISQNYQVGCLVRDVN